MFRCLTYYHPLSVVPGEPSNVQGLCTVVLWGEPLQRNGNLTGYDLRFYNDDQEIIVSNRSDEIFRAVKETDKPTGSNSIFVQVRDQDNRINVNSHISYDAYLCISR